MGLRPAQGLVEGLQSQAAGPLANGLDDLLPSLQQPLLPRVRVPPLVLNEDLQRLNQRRGIVNWDRFGEVEVVDGVSVLLEVGPEPGLPLVPR